MRSCREVGGSRLLAARLCGEPIPAAASFLPCGNPGPWRGAAPAWSDFLAAGEATA
jgi:hypothetical protein